MFWLFQCFERCFKSGPKPGPNPVFVSEIGIEVYEVSETMSHNLPILDLPILDSSLNLPSSDGSGRLDPKSFHEAVQAIKPETLDAAIERMSDPFCYNLPQNPVVLNNHPRTSSEVVHSHIIHEQDEILLTLEKRNKCCPLTGVSLSLEECQLLKVDSYLFEEATKLFNVIMVHPAKEKYDDFIDAYLNHETFAQFHFQRACQEQLEEKLKHEAEQLEKEERKSNRNAC